MLILLNVELKRRAYPKPNKAAIPLIIVVLVCIGMKGTGPKKTNAIAFAKFPNIDTIVG